MADSLRTLENLGYISDIATSENMFVVEDAGTALRDYADQGYDLVIGHGSQYGALIQEIAPDFPDVAFAWGTASDTFGLDNVTGYSAAADEGGFVMGRMGALMTESKQIGIIGPIEVGDGKLYADGFEAGVLDADESVDVEVNWTDSFSDVALAAEAATSFVNAGADVLTGSSQMTVGAIGVAKEQGVLWFGTDANQTQLAPDVVVANQVYKWEVVLSEVITGIQNGDLGGDAHEINLANGGEVIEFNEDFDLPSDVRDDADATIAGIADGSIETGVTE
jgi:basic membrane protein A